MKIHKHFSFLFSEFDIKNQFLCTNLARSGLQKTAATRYRTSYKIINVKLFFEKYTRSKKHVFTAWNSQRNWKPKQKWIKIVSYFVCLCSVCAARYTWAESLEFTFSREPESSVNWENFKFYLSNFCILKYHERLELRCCWAETNTISKYLGFFLSEIPNVSRWRRMGNLRKIWAIPSIRKFHLV